MGRTLPTLLILLLCGCSAKVEVSTERRPAPSDRPATETFSANVTVDLLTKQEQAPCPRPQSPAPTEVKLPEVEVAGTANLAIVEGDLNLHTHYGAVAGVTVYLNEIPIAWWKSDNQGNFVAKFNLDDVKEMLASEVGNEVTVTLTGETKDGVTFSGSDTIKVVKPKK